MIIAIRVQLVRKHGKSFIVDAMSSFGGVEIDFEKYVRPPPPPPPLTPPPHPACINTEGGIDCAIDCAVDCAGNE